MKPTYEEWLRSLTPPFKCVHQDHDWVATKKSNTEWTLMPCYCTTNGGKPLQVPIDTILTHIYIFNYDNRNISGSDIQTSCKV